MLTPRCINPKLDPISMRALGFYRLRLAKGLYSMDLNLLKSKQPDFQYQKKKIYGYYAPQICFGPAYTAGHSQCRCCFTCNKPNHIVYNF